MQDDDLPVTDEARKREIELLMRTDRRGYFRDEAVQREYLQILERREARQQGGGQKPLASGASVSIPDKRNTFAQLRREEDPDPIAPPAPWPTRPVSRTSPMSERGFPTGDDNDPNSDTSISLRYDQFYGDPSAGYLVPGKGSIRTTPLDDRLDLGKEESIPYRGRDKDETSPLGGKAIRPTKEIDGPARPVDADLARLIHRTRLAAQRSAVAMLGFDLSRVVVSPKDNERRVDVEGLYTPPHHEEPEFSRLNRVGEQRLDKKKQPRFDIVWADAKSETSLTHEFYHRGIQRLRDNNKFPRGINLKEPVAMEDGRRLDKEEVIVRALMLRHYGNAEIPGQLSGDELKRRGDAGWQVLAARRYPMLRPQELDQIEKAAAELYYEYQRPPTRTSRWDATGTERATLVLKIEITCRWVGALFPQGGAGSGARYHGELRRSIGRPPTGSLTAQRMSVSDGKAVHLMVFLLTNVTHSFHCLKFPSSLMLRTKPPEVTV